ncbi:hypothetical protein Bca52824_037922 [Brassica carinata]|uniref:Uncharacterized protein n=1 Tax=Brassica carinata TaxID=52824 RepID=A0A8X7RNP6_BRACI|nr:hypothetical protein Bca52824_037922 [Brassica carinata]
MDSNADISRSNVLHRGKELMALVTEDLGAIAEIKLTAGVFGGAFRCALPPAVIASSMSFLRGDCSVVLVRLFFMLTSCNGLRAVRLLATRFPAAFEVKAGCIGSSPGSSVSSVVSDSRGPRRKET